MKKVFKSMFVLLIVVGLVAVVFSPVIAKKIDTTPTLRDPVVSPMKTSDTFTSSVVEVGFLKGAVQLESQLMAPVGRTDEQFGSNGVLVNGLSGKEKVQVCFEFNLYNYKWAGNVFMWNGTQWVKQTTTFTSDPAATTWACASGLGNGTYALIMYYWGPQEMSSPTELPDV